ncbi:MAG TPA: metalloregulator ArsR/SmtB family transcription factor [Solirubrobacteraceae bacterium]|jgi:DNA-binding transcriptional ArsR family regulator|nr:metalloregulator ArsR/SmtB family transcription factor [Solirubrobacteraceae bacterium]
MPPPGFSDDLLALVTRRLKAVAEPSRIRIVKLLEQREATVQDLADELEIPHQNASSHLALLYQAGIVSRRKDGRKVWYALADFTICRLVEQAVQSTTGYAEELAAITELAGYRT